MDDDAPPPGATVPDAPAAAAAPHSATELIGVARRPGRVFEFVLTDRRRLASTIATGPAPAAVIALLLGCALFASLPLGCLRGPAHWWKAGVLFAGTSVLCAPTLHVFAAYVGCRLARLPDVARAGTNLFEALAGLLASLAPVTLFVAYTTDAPDDRGLGGYPAFVATNAAFVAVAGAVALLHQARNLLRDHVVGSRRAIAVSTAWITVALVVGGQLAFWLRPLFGIASRTGDPPYALGDEPTSTGARNFYEAMWQFATARDLQDGR